MSHPARFACLHCITFASVKICILKIFFQGRQIGLLRTDMRKLTTPLAAAVSKRGK